MPKDAPGRNDPCPCGSGKKYKKCCWSKDQTARPSTVVNEAPSTACEVEARTSELREDLRQLDDWMHEGEHAIEDGRFDRAEELCQKLLKGFPELIHGHYLLGKLRATQGRWAEAASAFEGAFKVVERDRDNYDAAVFKEIKGYLDEARVKQRV